jgi:hypothetical protein
MQASKGHQERVLNSLSENWSQDSSPLELGKLIDTAMSFDVLDKAALLAFDKRELSLVENLFQRIAQPYTQGHRDTLLYCCSMSDCSEYFPMLIEIAIQDKYSAAVEAAELIMNNTPSVKKCDIGLGLVRIELHLESKNTGDDDNYELLLSLGECLTNRFNQL